MLRFLILTSCFSSCLATLGRRYVDGNTNILRPFSQTATAMFHRYDFNNDGVIERSEMDFTFAVFDYDPQDGKVSHHEYTTFVNRTQHNLLALTHELFNIYDVNNDGMLDLQDYDFFFDLMDYNLNTKVEMTEFVHYWTITFEGFQHLIDNGGISDEVEYIL